MATCRVRRSHCCDLLPSEPCVRVTPHTAQASAAGEEIPGRPEHPILVSPDGGLSTPVLPSFQLALSNISVGWGAPSHRPAEPRGKSAPFQAGYPPLARPYPRHYSGAFASSGILYPL